MQTTKRLPIVLQLRETVYAVYRSDENKITLCGRQSPLKYEDRIALMRSTDDEPEDRIVEITTNVFDDEVFRDAIERLCSPNNWTIESIYPPAPDDF